MILLELAKLNSAQFKILTVKWVVFLLGARAKIIFQSLASGLSLQIFSNFDLVRDGI
jgi:hypothetical protein